MKGNRLFDGKVVSDAWDHDQAGVREGAPQFDRTPGRSQLIIEALQDESGDRDRTKLRGEVVVAHGARCGGVCRGLIAERLFLELRHNLRVTGGEACSKRARRVGAARIEAILLDALRQALPIRACLRTDLARCADQD